MSQHLADTENMTPEQWQAHLKNFMPADIYGAAQHTANNKDEISRSSECGCYYCLSIFKPEQINEWVNDEECPLCPYCGIDSVFGDASGYPVAKEFLEQMNKYWFDKGKNAS